MANKQKGPMDSVAYACIPTPSKDSSDFENTIDLKGDLDWKMVIGFGKEGPQPVLLQELDPKG